MASEYVDSNDVDTVSRTTVSTQSANLLDLTEGLRACPMRFLLWAFVLCTSPSFIVPDEALVGSRAEVLELKTDECVSYISGAHDRFGSR